MNFSMKNPLSLCFLPLLFLISLSITLSACSAVQRIGEHGPQGRGFLELLVEPNDAEVFIDEEYAGIIAGWHEQIVPVAPGPRKIELRAEGYITQRFDLTFAVDEQVTLELRMQREYPDIFDETIPSPTSISPASIQPPTPAQRTPIH